MELGEADDKVPAVVPLFTVARGVLILNHTACVGPGTRPSLAMGHELLA
jgi:hypothetical protein